MAQSFEIDFNKHFAMTKKKIKAIENNIQGIMEEVTRTQVSRPNAYWRGIRLRLTNEYKKLNAVYAEFAKLEIPRRFRNSVYQMTTKIKGLKSVLNTAKKTAKQLVESTASRQIVRVLYEEAIADVLASTAGGLKNMMRITRQTQQLLIDESLINISVAGGFEQGSLNNSIALIRESLRSKVDDALKYKRFVQAGSRTYKASYYAQMVSRVKFHEAHSHGAIATATNYGTDLVIISSHNTTTEICIPFEGKVFSLNGVDKRFPVLYEYPPFHPNCLHLMFPQFESGMEAQGSLQGFIDFSNDNAATPPFPSNFTPVANRKAG